MKQSVKKGEEVVVISGSAKGKRGKVLAVMPSKGRVIVEGVNIRKFHERKSQKNPTEPSSNARHLSTFQT